MAAHVGHTNRFTLCSGDPDCPRNPLSYSLLSPAPAGATLDANTGVFQWAPTAGQVGQTNLLVRLCDGGTPNFCVTNVLTISVTPNPPFRLEIEQLTPDRYQFAIRDGTTTTEYILQQTSELCGCPCKTIWHDLLPILPTQSPFTFEYRPTDQPSQPFRFFRLIEKPGP
jgi:hypothetical protein